MRFPWSFMLNHLTVIKSETRHMPAKKKNNNFMITFGCSISHADLFFTCTYEIYVSPCL